MLIQLFHQQKNTPLIWVLFYFLFFGHKTTWLMGSWFPNQGWNLGPPKWKLGSLNHLIAKEFPWILFSLFFFFNIYLFIWLRQALCHVGS